MYEFEYQHEICYGNLGSNVPNNGAGLDFELPSAEENVKNVEVVVRSAYSQAHSYGNRLLSNCISVFHSMQVSCMTLPA
jgi:hypothetical protein